MRPLSILMIALAITLPMLAQGPAPQVPEIDTGTAIAAIALLSGGLVVLRARQKK